jgi:hypothetical protein
MVQCVIDLQFARKTKIKASELICHPTTVSRNVVIEAKKRRQLLKKSLIELFQNHTRFSFTLDIWEDITNYVSRLIIFSTNCKGTTSTLLLESRCRTLGKLLCFL